MTAKEAIDIIKDYEVCGGGYCHIGGDEVEEAIKMAISALEDTRPKFSLICLRCRKPVGDYSQHTMDQIGYTKYSYCDDCLRESLRPSKERDKERKKIVDEVANKIDQSIMVTNISDTYSIGVRNGMRYCKYLLDGKTPMYEDVFTRRCEDD